MAATLVVFESKYGQASKIAEHIGEAGRSLGHEVHVLHVGDRAGAELPRYDAVIVVAPVYFSKHTGSIRSFVRAHAAELSKMRRTAFVSVSNSASAEGGRAEARRLAEATPRELGWQPDVVAIAAGALAYPRYGFLVRFVMKRIAMAKGQPTDTQRVYELTDWARLDEDIEAIFAPLEATAGVLAATA